MTFTTMYLAITLIIFLSPTFSKFMYHGVDQLSTIQDFGTLVLITILWPVCLLVVIPWKLLEKIGDVIHLDGGSS